MFDVELFNVTDFLISQESIQFLIYRPPDLVIVEHFSLVQCMQGVTLVMSWDTVLSLRMF